MSTYVSERNHHDCYTLRMKTTPDWEQQFLFLADLHFDNPHSDRGHLKYLLDQARERSAGVFVIGDFFDLMQSKGDRRQTKASLLKQYLGDDYVDLVIDDAVEFFRPYADIMEFVSEGNHDTAILKYLETNAVARFCKALGINHMGYSGFIRCLFERATGGGRSQRTIYFHHGSGGGGEVTKGTMRAQRQAAYIDADIYVGGHIHEEWRLGGRKVGLLNSGVPAVSETLHICIPPLKDEYKMSGGWHVEKGRPPKPTGGFWLKFSFSRRKLGYVAFDALKTD